MLSADSVAEHIDRGQGRVERRTCSVLGDLSLLESPKNGRLYRGWCASRPRAITRPPANRRTRPVITSPASSPTQADQPAIRQHWGIENKLHWVLDVAFGEDLSRKRAGNAAQNFSVLNRIALNLIRKDKSTNGSVRGKRLQAAWDDNFLWQLLAEGKS